MVSRMETYVFHDKTFMSIGSMHGLRRKGNSGPQDLAHFKAFFAAWQVDKKDLSHIKHPVV